MKKLFPDWRFAGLLTGLFVTALILVTSVHAAPHRHGISELLVALDGDILTMEISAPGKDLAGFESAPKTPDQKKRYTRVLAVLKSADKMFSLSKKAACEPEDIDILEQLAGHEDHEHAKEHKDEHDETHGEFRVRYVFRCDSPGKLDRIIINAFEHFPDMQSMKLKFIGPWGTVVRELSPSDPATGL